MIKPVFAERILHWFDRHGRHDLPWQKEKTLYRVWVAEIMLQQTQVKTVIPYYQRFMQVFPTLEKLASAPLDRVLECWAGLGYYTRARNLHKAALDIMQYHDGRFPADFDAVVTLPGIGRSTAGAILALALDQRHVILDGNVKRVLTRFHAIEGWPGQSAVEKQLWILADRCTPETRLADYTQAIMDLGATVCKRSSPECTDCPVQQACIANRQGRTEDLPNRRPRKSLPVKSARLLLLTDSTGAILLEKRPPSGIWGGLWSLPEAELDDDISEVCQRRWGYRVLQAEDGAGMRHSFSHYHLDITPCQVHVAAGYQAIQEPQDIAWSRRSEISLYALPAPVSRLLQHYIV